MTVRSAEVSKLFESITVETPASVRDRARELSGKFLEQKTALPLAPGDIAGSYEVIEVLGAGGQAVVYRAKHRQIGRHVALKVPRREVGDRLLREAQLAARLEHPSIARVEDIQLETPVPYMVVELCERGSLEDLLEQHPHGLDPARAREIAVSILRALAFAHQEGVVHRDVKPANILFDKSGNAKVADFGIGTMAAADGLSVSVELSQLSLLAGTPLYVAPEQENPDLRVNGRLDGRADLFSFGKVLFQMLTGASPRTIRPPSRLRKVLDPAWDDFIFKLLEERPEDRFPSADAALAYLPPSETPSASAVIALPPAPKPVVVVAPRAVEAPAPPRPAGPREETPWQEQGRILCQVFAACFLVGAWFAIASLFFVRDPFIPMLYTGAFVTAAGFCMLEGKRASRAKNPSTSAILAVAGGALLAFVGSAAGVHASFLGAEVDEGLAITLFVTLPVQALGFLLAWIGHRGLAPMKELAPTRRELVLLEALLLTVDALLLGLTLYLDKYGPQPLTMVPILATLTVASTALALYVAKLLRKPRWD